MKRPRCPPSEGSPMLDSGWARVIARTLPARPPRDVFQPAWQDLLIDHLAHRRRYSSRGARAAMHLWLIVRTVILVLNCMMVAVTETLRLSPGDASHRPGLEAPFKERLCMVLADFRNAFRLLVRERGFTAAAVLTLALGVGANVAVFAVVEATLLRPLPYPEADRLVIMNHRDKQTGITKEFIAIGDFVDLGERQSSFESFAAYDGGHVTI